MTAVTRPRGPLPARVYWTRRLLVLVVTLALVFGIAQLLGRGGSPGDGPSARPVGADPTSTTSASATAPPTPSKSPTGVTSPSPSTGRSSAGSPIPLARPTGPCRNDDIVAVPSVAAPAFAARPVLLAVTLTTRTSPACTWQVSAATLVLKITSGPDRIWSTQDCARAVPRQSVVVRREAPVTVSIVWNGLRSDAECSRATTWARTGYYHAVAAAFGAEPRDVQFRLVLAPPATRTASPTPSPTPSTTPSPATRPTTSARARPTTPARTPQPTG